MTDLEKQKQKQTVLVVDDSRTNIVALADLLRDEWKVRVATSGKEAVRIAFSKEKPDIILLDIMMPDMDGYEVIKQLKGAPETKDIPVIFVTAMNQVKDEEYGLSLGAIDYITKPISPPIVKARLRNHLELKNYRDLLMENSMSDGLTGVPNRRRFDETLKVEWKRALRYKAPMTLIMADIDHFKLYNDHYGHLAGDDCLKQVAKILSEGLKRPADLLARWGGEEFACLLPETDNEHGCEMANSLLELIRKEKIKHEHSTLGDILTISLGVATLIPNKDKNPEELIKLSDAALYKAKDNGRDRVFGFKED